MLGKCGGCGGTGSCGDICSSKLKEDKKARCDSENSLAVALQPTLQGSPLGMMEHLLSWPLWLLLKLPARKISGESMIAAELHFSLGSPQPCGYHAVLSACFFVNTYFAVFLCKWNHSMVLIASAGQFLIGTIQGEKSVLVPSTC